MRALVLYGLLSACAPHGAPGPKAVVRLVTPSAWTKADVEAIRRGNSVWVQLGFYPDVEKVYDLPPCPNDWYARTPQVTKCKIEIGIVRVPNMREQDGVDGEANRDNDTISVDARYTDWNLTTLVAHEVGHILINAGHLPPGEVGVMMARGAEWEPSPADLKFACEKIKRGCKSK